MTRCSLLLAVLALVVALPAPSATITVDVDKPGHPVSPVLYGIFFEEINRAGDGGIYAELVQNRALEDTSSPAGWSLIQGDGAQATMSLDRSQPLNTNSPTSLKLEVTKPGARAGVANLGFRGSPYAKGAEAGKGGLKPRKNLPQTSECANGIAVEQGKQYRLTFHARCDAAHRGPITASIERMDGTVVAQQKIDGFGPEWKQFTCELTATATEPAGQLVLSTASAGTLWLDVVSLMPKDTYRGHPLRKDLMEKLAAMKPGFIRFPGGCYVEGDQMCDAFRWKKSIGDIAQRPGHYNLWGYTSNDGLGYYEYLLMCEDLGAEPLFVINCGMAHKDHIPMDKMDEYVQDALDAIEYANGPADSKWGALRAAAGHPAPFNLKYMEIGNENGGPLYDERYALFHDVLRKRYPDMHLVVDYRPTKNRPAEIVDEHYYNSPDFFFANAGKYDKYDRSGPKVYVGEYAVTQNAGQGNLIAAVGEAAFMTGMERNSDVVVMSSYAPLFVNPDWRRWNPNAIVFDAARSYGTPSYHVQALFGSHRADVVLPVEAESDKVEFAKPGMIGVGTWMTQAEFKDIKVTRGHETLFAPDFAKQKNLKGWKTQHGRWEVRDGALRQTGDETDVRAAAGQRDWSDYTLSLKARKLGGHEGVLVMFQIRDVREKCWWNIGGWGNREHGLEGPGLDHARVPGKIETGRWYDIRVELKGSSVKCYLDGKLIHEVKREAVPALYACAGLEKGTNEIILKVVNGLERPQETTINLRGAEKLAATGRAIVLTSGDPNDENTFDAPTKVVAREEPLTGIAPTFRHTFPPHSVTVLRLPR